MSHGKKPTVLLIEQESSLRRLISLGLQDHNMYVVEARTPTTIPSFDTEQLDLIVIDVDRGAGADWSFLDLLESHTQLSTLPTIVLAWDYSSEPSSSSSSVASRIHTQTQTRMLFLTKPFDARALQDAIERLLQVRALQEAEREALVEQRLLASYSAHAAPSIWPAITAIGVLVIVCGLLLQFALVALGIAIVIAALLLWTLGTKPEPGNAPIGV